MKPLLDHPPRPGRWTATEKARIERALALVGDEWVPLYRVTRPSGAAVATWQARGFRTRHRNGCVEVARPLPHGLYCCCSAHRGTLLTIDEYAEAHG